MHRFYILLGVPNYTDLPDAIASKKYTAGLYNSDVLGYYQEELRERAEPLRIIKHITRPQPVTLLFPMRMSNTTIHLFEACYSTEMRAYTVELPVGKHRGYVKVSKFQKN